MKQELEEILEEMRLCKNMLLLEAEKIHAMQTGDYSLLRYYAPETPRDNVVYVEFGK